MIDMEFIYKHSAAIARQCSIYMTADCIRLHNIASESRDMVYWFKNKTERKAIQDALEDEGALIYLDN